MLLHSFLLAISGSLDAIGIGLSYGIKKQKLSFFRRFILFIVLITIAYISISFGNFLGKFISSSFNKLISNILLIILGIYFCYSSKIQKENENFTRNKPNTAKLISWAETLLLALALSLDSFCIGISASISDSNLLLFPIFVSFLHVFLLDLGIYLGKNISNLYKLPNSIWSIISGIILILIGLFRYFI